jgi:hypothetical protein
MALTAEEHALLLAFFTKQQQQIATILEILKSRGILTGDDAAAFRFAVATDAPANVALFREVTAAYVQFAKKHDIQLPPEIEKLG